MAIDATSPADRVDPHHRGARAAPLPSLLTALLLATVSAVWAPVRGQATLEKVAASWDRAFASSEVPTVDTGSSFAAHAGDRLLSEGRLSTGASALVLAMGDGRNALYLAARGFDVTGIDISGVGLRKAREEAVKRGVEIETIQADLFQSDLGRDRWDLVTLVYFNPAIQIFDRIKAAARPGGFVLVEGYGSDFIGPGPPQSTRFRPNHLLDALEGWRILEYHDGVFRSDWAGDLPVPVVRVLAQKPLVDG